jgi:hypothetical protein
MPEPSDTDWAYAAGFVDGEGCMAVVRSFVPGRDRYVYGVHVVVSNRDREVLEPGLPQAKLSRTLVINTN